MNIWQWLKQRVHPVNDTSTLLRTSGSRGVKFIAELYEQDGAWHWSFGDWFHGDGHPNCGGGGGNLAPTQEAAASELREYLVKLLSDKPLDRARMRFEGKLSCFD